MKTVVTAPHKPYSTGSLDGPQTHLAGRRTVPLRAYNATQAIPRPRILAIVDEEVEPHNPRKRPFDTEDLSLPDIITRPPKKPRIQNTSIDSNKTSAPPAATATILDQQGDQEKNHPFVLTQPIVLPPRSPVFKISGTLPRKSLRFALDCRSTQPSLTLQSNKSNKRQPRILEITIRQPEKAAEQDSKQVKPSSPKPQPVNPITKTHILSHTIYHPEKIKTANCAGLYGRGRLETAHTLFWTKVRESYTGSGPLTVDITDILEAKGMGIQAAIFTPTGSYQEKEFTCRGFHRPKT
ncbi:hypothetical protein BDZ94DRAFT_1296333 [Collybia nuda]|uniref:Uncharacterized protein n=1 Tax=Collybia nuda TaxID=64659 RepID=A0A9P6CGQ6_9AGAR|nr:hypothetical protein BDZ94DRAFT_1296333 [Collybia nuda]